MVSHRYPQTIGIERGAYILCKCEQLIKMRLRFLNNKLYKIRSFHESHVRIIYENIKANGFFFCFQIYGTTDNFLTIYGVFFMVFASITNAISTSNTMTVLEDLTVSKIWQSRSSMHFELNNFFTCRCSIPSCSLKEFIGKQIFLLQWFSQTIHINLLTPIFIISVT